MSIRILVGDALSMLATLPDKSVHCSVTSPPYFSLRDYSTVPVEWPALSYVPMPGLPPLQIPAMACELGQERTPEAYIGHLVLVWREVRRVLTDDAVCFINIGDSYSSGGRGNYGSFSETSKQATHSAIKSAPRPAQPIGLKPKDLLGIPWRLAFALQADGWFLRSDIIWSKPNPMPESVMDRPIRSHEYIFMLAKQERYFFDSEAIKEYALQPIGEAKLTGQHKAAALGKLKTSARGTSTSILGSNQGTAFRNKRSVWTIPPQNFAEAHFATYPVELPTICIKAATSEKGHCPECNKRWVRVVDRTKAEVLSPLSDYGNGAGRNDAGRSWLVGASTKTLGWEPSCACGVAALPDIVLDPFGGSGTTALAADRLQRDAILIELNEGYALMAKNRIHGDAPLFTEIAA